MSSFQSQLRSCAAAAVLLALSCDQGGQEASISSPGTRTQIDRLTFDEFKAQAFREGGASGVYIVNGDTPVLGDEALYAFWKSLYDTNMALSVLTKNGVDVKYNDADKMKLTYCVSNEFGANKEAVVTALREASDNGWEMRGNVNFIYDAAQDSNCTETNEKVLFDVRPVKGQPYLARAFFPNYPRAYRNVLIDESSFSFKKWELKDVLAHELGHALGFRHEHARQAAGRCVESGFGVEYNFRPVTDYDSASIMHYPQCNGTGTMKFSALDAEGIARVYGDAAGKPTSDYQGKAWGTKSATATGTVYTDPTAMVLVGKVEGAALGTQLTVSMQGSGNADLYVRFGAEPTFDQYDCRPMSETSNETCSMTVAGGADARTIFVSVVARQTATGSVSMTWTEGDGWIAFTPKFSVGVTSEIKWIEVDDNQTLIPSLVAGSPFELVGLSDYLKGYVQFGPEPLVDASCPGGVNRSYLCKFIVPPGKTTARVGVTSTKSVSDEIFIVRYTSEVGPACSVSVSPTKGSISGNTQFAVQLNLGAQDCTWTVNNITAPPAVISERGATACQRTVTMSAAELGATAGKYRIKLKNQVNPNTSYCFSDVIDLSQ